jgi:hypothetical protein
MARTARKTETQEKKPAEYKGVLIEKVNVDRLKAYLENFEIEVTALPGEDLRTALIDALLEHTDKAKAENAEILECPIVEGGCGAFQPRDEHTETACPVCGMTDDDAPLVAVEGQVVSADEGPEDEEDEDEEDDEKSISDSTETTKIVKRPRVIVESEPVQVTGTIQDLEASIERVKSLREGAATTAWDIGMELNQIFNSGTYKLRTGDDNLPKYQNFADFLKAELGFDRRQGNNLRAIATTFTREEAGEIGSAKLTAIFQAKHLSSEQRTHFLEKARAGTVLKELKAEAEKLLPPEKIASRNGAGKRSSRAAGAPVLAEPTEAGGKDNKVTCTFLGNKVELQLKRTSKDHIYEASQDLVNGVNLTYTIDVKKMIFAMKINRPA